MAWYPRAIARNIPPTSNDPRIRPDTVVLHVDASDAYSLYGWFNGPSGGVESHFHVRRDGTVEQYRDTAYQADAQMGGGRDAISIETQGRAAGEWTPPQLATIKDLLLWLAAEHSGIQLRVPSSPDGPGVGYHSQFPEWPGDARSCPGPDRIKQYRAVLVPWMADPMGDDDVNLDDKLTTTKAQREVWGVKDGEVVDVEDALVSARYARLFAYRASVRANTIQTMLAGIAASQAETLEVLRAFAGGGAMPSGDEILARIERAARERMAQLTFDNPEETA